MAVGRFILDRLEDGWAISDAASGMPVRANGALQVGFNNIEHATYALDFLNMKACELRERDQTASPVAAAAGA